MHAKFYGKVQGVGMRAHVRSLAMELSLKGCVKNCPDGSVEVVAQGASGKLEDLVTKIKMRFGIDRVVVDFRTPLQAYEGFHIV